MGIQVEGQVGPRVVGDGGNTELRQGRLGSLVTVDGHGRYYESTSRGFVWEVCTAAAGVAPGTALSTTPPLALWNPPNSGVNAAVDEALIGYISGTIGAGTLVYAVVPSQQTLPTGGTQLVPVGANTTVATPKCKVFQGSTLVSTPQIFKPCFILNATLATAPAAGGPPAASPCKDEAAGIITVPPGSVLCLQGIAAAGTTPLVLLAFTWEEVPQ